MRAPAPRIVDDDTQQWLGVVAAQFGLTAAALRTEAKRRRPAQFAATGLASQRE